MSRICFSVFFLSCASMLHATPSDEPTLKACPREVILTSGLPDLEQGWGVILLGDYLYWQAHEEGLEYAMKGSGHPLSGKVVSISPQYQNGFRVGLSMEIPKSRWDVTLSWTSYENKRHSSVVGEEIFSYWNTGSYSHAEAKWHLNFNTVALDLGCAFFPRLDFELRPFAGIQGAWIHQGLHVQYVNPSEASSHFQGWGMQVGFDAKWVLGYGFALQASCSGAMLASDFHTTCVLVRRKEHTLVPVLQMLGEVKWELSLSDERFYFDLHAGWEQQIWWKQNQLIQFPLATNPGYAIKPGGDLSLSGLTLGARFGF